MASTHILAVGKVKDGIIEMDVALLPPPTREERADEAAYLADTARYYEWLKSEREDYQDYLADVEFFRHGC